MVCILQGIFNFFKRHKATQYVESSSQVDYSAVYNHDGNFKDDFYLNLKKTIAWTEDIISQITDTSKINYQKVLRTTNPFYEGEPFYKFDDSLYNYASPPDIPFNYSSVLNDALNCRSEKNLSKGNLNELGKILKFEIDLTTRDGAACAESEFVDESDIPPIDTWFYITTKYLYCWIPTMFIEKMQSAIDVEIFDSYVWLEEVDAELNQHILNTLARSSY